MFGPKTIADTCTNTIADTCANTIANSSAKSGANAAPDKCADACADTRSDAAPLRWRLSRMRQNARWRLLQDGARRVQVRLQRGVLGELAA